MAEITHSQPQLGINGYRPRQPFVDFHNREQRWATLVCHRRAGKTVACIAELVLAALFTSKQDARYAYVAPQYNQAKDIAWAYVKQLTADIPNVVYNETELRADLPNGARVRLYGADNPDRLRGLYMDGVVLDEFADMRSSVWGEIIRPLLADRKGWAVFIGTPKGHNEFHAKWLEAGANPAWFPMMLRASESGLIDASELVDAARGMTEDQYAQEFECSFEAAIAGAFYGRDMNELEKAGRIGKIDYQSELPVFTAWDIGFTDDTAVWFFQMIRGEMRVIDFYAANGHGVDHYADMLDAKGYNYAKLAGKPLLMLPHDAAAKTFAAQGKSTQEQFSARGYTSRIVPSLSLQDGIQAVRMTLPRCVFDRERCAEGIESLKLYQREWDSDKKCFRDKPRHDWTSHAADAFRMAAIVWREQQAPEAAQQRPKFERDLTIAELIKRQSERREQQEWA
jgi:phage terminase large subunit